MSAPAVAGNRRYLTKSKFVLALECPTKLKYAGNKEYANHYECNEFLKALAESGHQVGALGKTLLGAGTEITEIGHEEALKRTAELLRAENALLYEAAFAWESCFVRVDLLEKRGSQLNMYEVKAKSFDATKGIDQFFGARGGITSDFKPYLYDVAFQRFVLARARPDLRVSGTIVLVNKAAVSKDAVLQRLRIRRVGDRVSIDRDETLGTGDVARQCLAVIPIDEVLDRLEKDTLKLGKYEFGFDEGIHELMRSLESTTFAPRPGQQCKSCEFRASADELAAGKRDGRVECLSSCFSITESDFRSGSILDLHSVRSIEKLLSVGKVLLQAVTDADLSIKKEDGRITLSQRHFLQSEEARGAVRAPRHVRDTLRVAMVGVTYPLHFVDFETARPVLPFHAGRRPYEQVLFQFSHHEMDQEGRSVHSDQFLHDEVGVFPNYSVLRALKAAIGSDAGSVIHWWEHEKTVLSEVRRQLENDQSSIADAADLIRFIDDLVGSADRPGRMLDLGRLVESALFLPGTRGSSSLKKVLPALINCSNILRKRYSPPAYGAAEGMASLNFHDHSWIVEREDGRYRDPYELLGERFADKDLAGADVYEEEGVIADGGAAMIAYGLLESPETSAAERAVLRSQLLRYCELDTLAMVMAWEALKELSESPDSAK